MNDPLEDRLHDALHHRVDPMRRAPITTDGVRTRARRIRRRRTVTAAAAVAAVLAVAVPAGLSMTGSSQRGEAPLVTQPPAPRITGTVPIDPRSAPVGDAAGIPMISVNDPGVIVGEETIEVPDVYDAIVRYLDGWVATVNVEGMQTVQVLDQDFQRVSGSGYRTTGLTVSADGSRIAWAEYDGGRWSVVDRAADGSRQDRRTELPPGPEDASVTTVGFASDTEVVVSQEDPSDDAVTALIADGTDVAEIRGPLEPRTASVATGAVAGVVSRDADSSTCSAVIDVRTRAESWETCDYEPVSFSPDGRHVAAFAAQYDGSGSPSLALLDASTGDTVVDFELVGPPDSFAATSEVAWEDDETLLLTMVSGNVQYVVRVGLDGTVERVGGPVNDLDPESISSKFATSQAGT